MLPGKEAEQAAIVGVGRGAASNTDPSTPTLYPGVIYCCSQNQTCIYEHLKNTLRVETSSQKSHLGTTHLVMINACHAFMLYKDEIEACHACCTKMKVILDLSKASAVWQRKKSMWRPL